MSNALIFDVDGVLADSEPLSVRTLHETFLARCGITLTHEDTMPYMGTTAPVYVGGLLKQFNLDADMHELIEHHETLFTEGLRSADDLPILPSVDLLHRIADTDEWTVGLATSAARLRSEATIEGCGINTDSLSAWLTGDNIDRAKPDPEIYIACALALGVPPSNCVVIEDSVNGVLAAKAARMACIALVGTFPGEELRYADRIVDCLSTVDQTMLYDLIHEAAEARK